MTGIIPSALVNEDSDLWQNLVYVHNWADFDPDIFKKMFVA